MTPKQLQQVAAANGLAVTVGPAMKMPGVELVKRRPPDVRTGGRWSVMLVLRCRAVSEANRTGEHWTTRRRRRQIQREALTAAFHGAMLVSWPIPLPCVVTWVRVFDGRSGKQDDDNLRSAFKGLRDDLAARIGVDDGDPAVVWAYEQKAGPPGVELRIEGGK